MEPAMATLKFEAEIAKLMAAGVGIAKSLG